MKKYLISVIIPVYNTEQYLVRCIDSIIYQTYRNLEIILIDDGSTDGSGKICDEYAKKDTRIQVIHKENEGQSIARNIGLEKSNGDYISFIDSDDFLDKVFYEEMMSIIKTFNCDLAICDYKEFSDVKSISPQKEKSKKIDLSKEDAIKSLLKTKNSKITNYLWNKLYKKDILKKIKMPRNNIYEDLAVMYKIIDNSKKICYYEKKLYYYFNRSGSSSKKIPSKNILDKIELVKEREKYLISHGYNLSEELNEYRFFSDINCLKVLARNADRKNFFENDILLREYEFIKKYYKKNSKVIKKCTMKEKILLTILIFSKKTYFYIISTLFEYKK